ncbi:UNVERIFIED_CONTAM: hypothetical protein ABIC26_001562 [Paenibacillus sp. PvR008]
MDTNMTFLVTEKGLFILCPAFQHDDFRKNLTEQGVSLHAD